MKIDIKISKSINQLSWTSNKRSYDYFDITYKGIEKVIEVSLPFAGITREKEEIALTNSLDLDFDGVKLIDRIKSDYILSDRMRDGQFFSVNQNYELMFRREIESIADFIKCEDNIDFDYYLIRLSCLESTYNNEKDLLTQSFKFSSKSYPYAEDSEDFEENSDEQVHVFFKNRLCL